LEVSLGDIVKSKAGRDKDILFVVLRNDKDFVYMANGTGRKVDNLKKKRRKHVSVLQKSQFIANKLLANEKVTNVELRRELTEYCESCVPDVTI